MHIYHTIKCLHEVCWQKRTVLSFILKMIATEAKIASSEVDVLDGNGWFILFSIVTYDDYSGM